MSYDFDEQFEIGKRGVEVVGLWLAREGHAIVNKADNKEEQRRGIDLWAIGVGNVEVKLDTTDFGNVFLEVESGHKPGAVFNSRADWLYVVYEKQHVIFTMSLPRLQQWIAQHYSLLNTSLCKKVVSSSRGAARWSVTGFIVPRETLIADIEAKEVSYAE